jgi:hypothetical protein
MLLDMSHTLRGGCTGGNREREGNPKLECDWCAHYRGANIVILNWQRPLWEGDQEAVKRSGGDEPMWFARHMCMEATLGISLYSYVYLPLAKLLWLSYYLLCFLFNKIGEQDGRTVSAWKWCVCGERWPKQCIHMWVNVKPIKKKRK